MTVTSHRIGALAAASTVIAFGGMETHSVATIICYIIGAVTGSLLPDADTPYSRMGRRYLCILWPFYLLQYMIHLFAPRSYMDKTVKFSTQSLALYLSQTYRIHQYKKNNALGESPSDSVPDAVSLFLTEIFREAYGFPCIRSSPWFEKHYYLFQNHPSDQRT